MADYTLSVSSGAVGSPIQGSTVLLYGGYGFGRSFDPVGFYAGAPESFVVSRMNVTTSTLAIRDSSVPFQMSAAVSAPSLGLNAGLLGSTVATATVSSARSIAQGIAMSVVARVQSIREVATQMVNRVSTQLASTLDVQHPALASISVSPSPGKVDVSKVAGVLGSASSLLDVFSVTKLVALPGRMTPTLSSLIDRASTIRGATNVSRIATVAKASSSSASASASRRMDVGPIRRVNVRGVRPGLDPLDVAKTSSRSVNVQTSDAGRQVSLMSSLRAVVTSRLAPHLYEVVHDFVANAKVRGTRAIAKLARLTGSANSPSLSRVASLSFSMRPLAGASLDLDVSHLSFVNAHGTATLGPTTADKQLSPVVLGIPSKGFTSISSGLPIRASASLVVSRSMASSLFIGVTTSSTHHTQVEFPLDVSVSVDASVKALREIRPALSIRGVALPPAGTRGTSTILPVLGAGSLVATRGTSTALPVKASAAVLSTRVSETTLGLAVDGVVVGRRGTSVTVQAVRGYTSGSASHAVSSGLAVTGQTTVRRSLLTASSSGLAVGGVVVGRRGISRGLEPILGWLRASSGRAVSSGLPLTGRVVVVGVRANALFRAVSSRVKTVLSRETSSVQQVPLSGSVTTERASAISAGVPGTSTVDLGPSDVHSGSTVPVSSWTSASRWASRTFSSAVKAVVRGTRKFLPQGHEYFDVESNIAVSAQARVTKEIFRSTSLLARARMTFSSALRAPLDSLVWAAVNVYSWLSGRPSLNYSSSQARPNSGNVIMTAFVANTNILDLEGLRSAIESVYINDAAVTVTVLDHDGNAVAGVTWPLVMSYVAGTDGCYRAILPHDLALEANRTFTAAIHAVAGAERIGDWKVPFRPSTRVR